MRKCLAWMEDGIVSLLAILSMTLMSTYAVAAPDEIDVVGLTPGRSTKADFDRAKREEWLVIGGFRIVCIPAFASGKLLSLTCPTGEDNLSFDTTQGKSVPADNITIHRVLVDGFTKKFGHPDSVENSPVQTRLGTELSRSTVQWKDKRGNELILISIGTKIGSGGILLRSAEKVKKDKEAETSAQERRKF